MNNEVQKKESQSPLSKNRALALVQDQTGRIGYVIAWLCGVPASVLFVIFLLRGH